MQIGDIPAIAAHAAKFMGIRNGIDPDIWDPENDNLLPMPYTASNVVEVRPSHPIHPPALCKPAMDPRPMSSDDGRRLTNTSHG